MENAAPIDWISNLPDELLCYILSLLPTKLAFSTTVLSKRWTPLTKLLTALHFHDESVKDEAAFSRFCSFVDTVTASAELIKTFHLDCDSIHWHGRFNNWIQTAKRHPLENLYLYFPLFNFYNRITLPPTTFTFPKLVVLKFKCFCLDGDISVDLPSLRTLHLDSVYLKNHESFKKFIYGCPILEDLNFTHVYYFTQDKSSSSTMNTGEFKSLSKLIRADILDSDVPVTAVYNVQILKVWVTRKLPEQVIIPNNRRFQNLIHLELYVSASDYCEDLMDLLQNCPKLQRLTIAELLDQDLFKNWKYPNTVPNYCRQIFLTKQQRITISTPLMENAAPIDSISNLPDELLCNILSLLPTKLAFSTTVLSKRLTPLSKLLTALHFHDKSVKDEAAFLRFCSFVDTVTVCLCRTYQNVSPQL
ncbi:putative FBD-associated F-box protein At3g50710 [Vicia villosa]|uniref:putative FBD-associated F-box protein At3g50710 n=1 Tax=Vicia villosa TaxID=3911 RepID=UPI00273B08A0|nr:putative FBD-associated F-box protein At3g50710 [Vicia villosa]